MATSTRKASTGWIRVFISLGLVVTLLGIFLPTAMKNFAISEVQRYQECASGRRDNCKASLVWILYEQALKKEGGSGLLLKSIQDESRLFE